jgi:hypothetical protein
MNPKRRPLKFEKLDQIMPDVDRLLAGHTTVGNWNLGQMCKHLSETFVFSVDGFPMKMPWILRKTIGRIIMRQVLRSNEMKEGIKVPDRFIPEPGADSRAEAEALRGAIKLFSAHPGPFAEHPFFGTMTRDQWDHLHRIHCAHHLSFAQPSGLA